MENESNSMPLDIKELDAQLEELEKLLICLELLARALGDLSKLSDLKELISEAAKKTAEIFNPCLFGIYTEHLANKKMQVFMFNPKLLKHKDELLSQINKAVIGTLGKDNDAFKEISVNRNFLWKTEPAVEQPLNAWMVVPIQIYGTQKGIAFIASSYMDAYSKDLTNLFSLFCAVLGSYIENISLLSETRELTISIDQQLQEVERLIITLESAQRAAQEISQTIDLDILTTTQASHMKKLFAPKIWGYIELLETTFTDDTPYKCTLFMYDGNLEKNVKKIAEHVTREINRVSRSRYILESDITLEIRNDFIEPGVRKQGGLYDNFVSHPMAAGDRRFGVAFMYSDTLEQFSPDLLNLFYLLTQQFSATFENIRLFKKTEWYATYDVLTNIYNRRTLEELLHKQLAASKRSGEKFTICILDIDRFKRVNDTYGHEIGDEVLRQTAAMLKESIRINDIIARYGGEEFVVIITDSGTYGAFIVAERLRKAIENLEVRFGFQTLKITISLGLATYPDHGIHRDALLEHADEALYKAKNAGRNRTVVYSKN